MMQLTAAELSREARLYWPEPLMLRDCAATITKSGMRTLINPVQRSEPLDHPDWAFEPKFDGFRAAADTVRGRLISRNGNRMWRFEAVLDLLPKGPLQRWPILTISGA